MLVGFPLIQFQIEFSEFLRDLFGFDSSTWLGGQDVLDQILNGFDGHTKQSNGICIEFFFESRRLIKFLTVSFLREMSVDKT